MRCMMRLKAALYQHSTSWRRHQKSALQVDWEKIPIPPEALALQKHFEFSDEQVLAMSSTGTILAAVAPEAKEKVA